MSYASSIVFSYFTIAQIIISALLALVFLVPIGENSVRHMVDSFPSYIQNFRNIIQHQGIVEFPYRTEGNASTIIDIIANDKLEEFTGFSPFIYFIKTKLKDTHNKDFVIRHSIDKNNKKWFWINIVEIEKKSNKDLQLGFQAPHFVGFIQVIVLVLVASIIFSFLISILIAKKFNKPIQRLYQGTKALAKGNHLELSIEKNSTIEFTQLTEQFNKTSLHIHNLISNRTILLAGIAHDLRTPLTQMVLALELLDNDKNAEAVSSLRKDLDRMEELIQHSLNLGMDLSETEETSEVHIHLELKNIVNRISSNDEKISVSFIGENDLCGSIYLVAFRRIMDNFLSNAIRYGEGNPIDVVAGYNEKGVFFVKVKDRGIGITEEQAKKVFDAFYRVEDSRNRKTGGSGVGLALVKQLTEMHKWTAKVVPREGGGVVATLTIPCGHK